MALDSSSETSIPLVGDLRPSSLAYDWVGGHIFATERIGFQIELMTVNGEGVGSVLDFDVDQKYQLNILGDVVFDSDRRLVFNFINISVLPRPFVGMNLPSVLAGPFVGMNLPSVLPRPFVGMNLPSVLPRPFVGMNLPSVLPRPFVGMNLPSVLPRPFAGMNLPSVLPRPFVGMNFPSVLAGPFVGMNLPLPFVSKPFDVQRSGMKTTPHYSAVVPTLLIFNVSLKLCS